jgi:hypothetical protein
VNSSADADGFSLVELLVAVGIMLAITAAVFTIVNPSRGIFQVQPEADDLQQRSRVAVEALQRDLMAAGAGSDLGGGAALNRTLAPILPYRAGEVGSDPANGVFHRSDVVSLISVASTAAQATVRSVSGGGSALSVAVDANCGPGPYDRLCGLPAGTRVLLFDTAGHFDVGTIASVSGLAVQIEGSALAGHADPAKGARLAAVETHTYWLDAGRATGIPRLMHYDGWRTDSPVVDHVVGLELAYFGEARAPALLPGVELSAPEGPWTTYGPRPPPVGVDDPHDGWPAGENCVFQVVDGVHVSRLANAPPGPLIAIEPSMLIDGPWCPDAGSARRFDADLLRIRRIRVVVRFQVASAVLRGLGPLFTHPGTATSAAALVPDQEVAFDIAPRNMNLAP